jgi:D-amino-acid dehydrogenase
VPSVVVIGAGVIGLSAAYELCQRGVSVTVIDMESPGDGSSQYAMGVPGSGASWGNAGWLCPSLCLPLNAPGTVVQGLRMMLHADSPLFIRPSLDVSLALWLLDFWRHCNAAEYRAATAAIAALARDAPALYQRLAADGVAVELEKSDVLSPFVDEVAARAFHRHMQGMAGFGYVQPEYLTGSELTDLEPHLSAQVRAGVLLRGQHYVRPDSLLAGLAHRVEAMGATLRTDERVVGLDVREGRVVSATTAADRLEADEFVLCAGVWSPKVARNLKIRLPIRPGRGYSITVTNPSFSLSGLVNLEEGRVVCTQMKGRLRFSGTMEFSPMGHPPDRRRFMAIRRTVARFLDYWPAGESELEWAGPRPMTSDGLPIIGRAAMVRNLLLATGHGMLGILLGPPTGVAVADLLTEGASRYNLRPFDPRRF